jgi:hypothetical protein
MMTGNEQNKQLQPKRGKRHPDVVVVNKGLGAEWDYGPSPHDADQPEAQHKKKRPRRYGR